MEFNIFLFNNFETLDIFGPIEIFGRDKSNKIKYYSLNGVVAVSSQGVKVYTEKIEYANKKAFEWVKNMSDKTTIM